MFSERMRLNRFRRKREKTNFSDELRVIPRWLRVAVVLLFVLAIAIGTLVNLGHSFVIYSSPNQGDTQFHHQIWPWEFRNEPVIASLILAGTITAIAIPLAGFLLLLGYVYRDAKRRGMQAGLWLLLILILLYFFLREPLPYGCPQCGTTVGARFNYCPNCDNNLNPSCPHCRQEVAEADKFCPNCGNTLSRGSAAAPAPSGEISPAQ